MLLLLNLVLTIVSTLCALCLLLLGGLLLLGKLPLRFDRHTRSQLRRRLGLSVATNRPLAAAVPAPTPAMPARATFSGSSGRNDPATTLLPQPPLRPTTSQFPRVGSADAATALQPPTAGGQAGAPVKSAFATDGIAPPETPVDPNSTEVIDSRTNERLLIQLLQQLEGDVERRDRLINYAKYRHPGQSYTWYLEKVMHELDRNR